MIEKNQTIKTDTLRWGIAAGVSQAIYIGLVALFMNAMQGLGKEPLGGFISSFLFFLLFFVLSAVISAILVFGRPIYLLVSGNFKQAVTTLLATILILLVILLIVFLVILI